MKYFRRALCLLLSALILTSCVPAQALKEPVPALLPPVVPEEGSIAAGVFYLGSENAELAEDGGSRLLLIGRGMAEALPEAQVRLVMTDITAHYGEDYTVREYQGSAKTENAKDSIALIDVILENADELEAYNNTDVLVETGVLPEAGTESEDTGELSDEEMAEMNAAMHEALYGEETAPAVLNDSLRQAKSALTGIKSDRVPMTNSAAGEDITDRLLETFSEDLNCAYLTLSFDEGETEKYIELVPKNNARGDGDRMFNLTLTPESDGAVVCEGSGMSVTIRDDEEQEPAVISFTSSKYRPEDGYVRVELERSGAENQTVSVRLTTEEGNAAEGENYSGVDATVVFPFGVKENYVNIPVSSETVEDEADFSLSLSEPRGAVLGATSAAGVTILSTDASFVPQLTATGGDLPLGETMKGFQYAYNCRHSSDSYAYSKVTKEEDDVEGETIKIFADWPTWNCSGSTWCGCNLQMNKTDDYLQSLFYEGVRIRGKACGDADDDDDLRVRVDQEDKYGNVSTGVHALYDDLDKYKSKKNIDVYFKKTLYCEDLYVEVYRDDGDSRSFYIYEWSPILRPFTVKLLQADPLQFYDADGNLKDNTAIGGLEHANQAVLQLPHATGTEGTFYYGDTIDVLRKEDSGAVTKLTGFDMVKSADKSAAPLVLAYGEPTASKSLKLDMDAPYIYDFITPSYWDIAVGGDDTERKGMYNVTVNVKPSFTYIDTDLKIYGDAHGTIEFTHGTYKGTGSDAYGDYTLYTIHQGDYVHLKPTADSGYTTNGVRVTAESAVGSEEFTQYIRSDGYARFRNGSYTQIRVFPEITERTNAIRVQVDKADLSAFQNLGMLQDSTVTATREDCGTYYEYTVVSADKLVPGQYYTLSAFPTAGTAEWVVTPAGGEARTYCQNTFVFRAQRDASHNIVRLQAPSSNGTVRLSADLTVLVQQAQIGGTEVYTIPAENALAVLDEEHIGLLDENGSVSFSGASATASSQELWRRICISYGGRSFYEDLKIPASAAGSSVRLTPAPITINVTDGLDRPVLSDVTAADEYGTVSAYIAIDGTKRIFTAAVGRDGTEYTDTAGVTREESITGVKFVVVDPDSSERKMVLAAQKKDAKTWQAEWTLYSGYEDQYAVGDQVWVELTTDRVVGDGKAYVDGSTGEKNDYLRQTVYPLMPTKLVFTASIPAEQPPQNIALPDFENVMDSMPDENGRVSNGGSLPFIENFSLNLNLGRIKVSMTPHPADSSKVVVSFGVGIINKGILNKDYKGWYQPSQNPDPDLLKRLDDAEKRMGAKKFGYAGRFFGKPKWDVSVGLNLILTPSTEVSGGYDIESGVLFVAVNASITYNAYFLVVVVPVYFCGQVSGRILAGAKFSSDVPLDIGSQFFEHMEVAFQTTALVTVDIYAGVGLAGVLGARGGVNFTLNFLYDSGIEDMTPVGLQFRIFGKVWVDLFVMTLDYRWEIIDPLNLGYYKAAANAQEEAEASKAMLTAATRTEDYEVRDKVLDGEASKWYGDSGSVTSTPYGGSTTVLLRNGYDWADPQLLYMGEDYGTLLVFVDKRAGETNGIDNTVLKYSVLQGAQGTTWSQPKVLYETTTADFQPSLCDMGDRVLISWVSRDETVDPADYEGDVNKLLQDLDVYTVEYVKSSGTVTNFTRLTNDDYFNSEPQAVYVPDSSDIMVLFQKSEVALKTPAPLLMASSGTSNISRADSLYLSNVLPTVNNCEIAYMVRSGGEWSRDYEPERRSGLLTASQAKTLQSELGGQRFLSTPIQELDTNDPLLTDLDTVAFEKYVLYAFSVDADNDLATGNDRAVYLQVYDTKTGTNYAPVRVRETDVIQSSPQILLRPDTKPDGTPCVEPMLFWLEDSENVCYTGLLPYLRTVIEGDSTFAAEVDFTNPDNLFALGGVFFGSLDPAKKPSLNGYNACTDSEGNLYITWSQPVYEDGKCTGQEVFAAAQIITDTPGENDNGVSWSEGVQLTYSGKTNDQQAITVDGGSRIIVVNNQLELDMKNDAYAPKNIMMVASILYPTCMLEVTDLSVSNKTPKAGETVTVRGNIKNTGLLPADGYKVEELGGYTTPIDGSDTPIVPSGKKPFSFDMTIPADGTLPTLTFLLSQVDKNGGSDTRNKTKPISLFRSAPVYAITDARTVQESDGIYLECTVANNGNAASDDSGAVLRVGRNNVTMDFDAEDTAYLEIPMGAIPVGETKTFHEKLTIPDADFIDNTAYAYVCVADSSGEWLTKPVSLYVSRTVIPTAISIPGAVNGALRLSAGQTKSLRGVTCKPAASAGSARFLYTVDDSSVAVVENGQIRAVNGGSTNLTVTVLPSGERFIVPLTVNGHGHTPEPEPKSEPKSEPEKPQKAEECSRGDDCPLRVYSDLDPWGWYHDGVEFCLKNHLMVGIAEDVFAPASTTTRGMMMTILARMEGADGPGTPWYAKGREWAMAAGVSDGTDPESTVTREQFVSMMFRYAGYKGLHVSGEAAALTGFADASQIHDWARSAMEWACGSGILSGKGGGILDPRGPLTRAEAAAIIERYCRLTAPDA